MKKMVDKKFICLFLALAVSISLASAIEVNVSSSSSSLPDTANLIVSSLRYEPYPVEPGEVFDLWIKIENNGKQQAQNAACRLVLDNPFSLYQGDLIQTWGILGSRQQAVFEYKLRVSESAAEGENELKVECAEDAGAGTWRQTSLMIKVQSRYPTLNIKSVETEPSAITPGHKADLIILLENMADSSMKDINIKIDFTSVPFAPYQEIGEKKLRMLESGKNESLIFSIVALPSAEGGIYKVPVEIAYTDNVGTSQSIDAIISLEINSMPDLYVTADSSELTRSTRTGTINLKVTNKGLTNIKFMNVKMLQSKQIKIISPNMVYIGDVDSDDSETAEFKITAKSTKLTIPLELSYRDVSNNLYTEQVNVTYNLLSNSEAGKGGTNWILIIIILAAIIFAYIKRKIISGWIKSKF
jgi:hypothetical protein